MDAPKKRCFVVMGFGEKVDFATGRKLNLDASYQNLIKPAVEEAGLECVRADEIAHSGSVNVPMYKQLLEADLVIADVSAADAAAFYQVGVRHALRPYRTIVIAEDQFKQFPFEWTHVLVRTYKHLGEDVSVSEARWFSAELSRAIVEIFESEPPSKDSPVYAYLNNLRPPAMPGVVLPDTAEPPPTSETHDDGATKDLWEQVSAAKKSRDFVKAKALLSTLRATLRERGPDKPEDPYVIQQLALATYESKEPDARRALEEARELLLTLDPATSNDTETLRLWGTVHRNLWQETHERAHLDEAVRGYERGFYRRNDDLSGINLAYLLNVRAANAPKRADAVADFVEAQRVRREVLAICEEALTDDSLSGESRYWVLGAMAEAYVGLGDEENAEKIVETVAAEHANWELPEGFDKRSMLEGIDAAMTRTRSLLADSPLKYVITS